MDNELRIQNYTRYSEKLRVVEGDSEDYKHYQMLCRGEDIDVKKKHPPVKDKRCFYSTNNGHPYLLLRPLKVEVFSQNPYIAMYYDLIEPNEIDLIKELSMPVVRFIQLLN